MPDIESLSYLPPGATTRIIAYSANGEILGYIPFSSFSSEGGGSEVPAGVMWLYGGGVAPSGWLLCDYSAVSRATYSALFAVIGVTFGVGDGVNTFNLPGFPGRVAVGAGQGAGLTNRTLGEVLGEESHSLSADENGEHSHGLSLSLTTNTGSGGRLTDSGSDRFTATSGLGLPHNNIQPALVTNFIIKY